MAKVNPDQIENAFPLHTSLPPVNVWTQYRRVIRKLISLLSNLLNESLIFFFGLEFLPFFK